MYTQSERLSRRWGDANGQMTVETNKNMKLTPKSTNKKNEIWKRNNVETRHHELWHEN